MKINEIMLIVMKAKGGQWQCAVCLKARNGVKEKAESLLLFLPSLISLKEPVEENNLEVWRNGES